MRRAWLIPLVLLLSGATPIGIRTILERAVTNERQAAARYDSFAQKAVEEGYLGAASLFKAAARAERVHAARFERAMKEGGLALPDEAVPEPTVGSTLDNLRQAATLETAERDGIYHDAIAIALDNGDETLAKIFDQTRDVEVEHANLMHAAARQLDQLKEPKAFYVCDKCGYTTDVELPLCALCRIRQQPHKVE